MDTLADREDDAWDEAELLIASKKQANYDQAVSTLTDLRDLARREQNDAFFTNQLRDLRQRHAPKSSFIRRLDQAGI